MVAPNPQLRISPSGPLAESSDDGGLAPPLDGMAGNLYGITPTGPTAQIIDASIGPSTGPADKTSYCYLYSGSVNPDSNKINGQLNLFGLSSGVNYGAGIWLVEADLEVGFTTSEAQLNFAGKLLMNTYLANADGSFVKADVDDGSVYGSVVTLGGVDSASSSFPTMKAVAYKSLVQLTEADIETAGGELTSVRLRLQRATAPNPVGAYGADSGYLQIGINGTVRVRRLR